MQKLILAFTALLAATKEYWRVNDTDPFPDLPEDSVYVAALENADAAMLEANENFNKHVEVVGNIYEDTKQQIMSIQADALANVKLEDIPGKMEAIFNNLQRLRDLACAEYNPEAWQALEEYKNQLNATNAVHLEIIKRTFSIANKLKIEISNKDVLLICPENEDGVVAEIFEASAEIPDSTQRANRMIECYNLFAGIENPTEYLASLKVTTEQPSEGSNTGRTKSEVY